MHLYLINHYATTPDSPSGSRHYDLARALVQKGHTVTIFASGYNHFTHRVYSGFAADPTSPALIEEQGGVRYVWLRTTPYEGNGLGRLRSMAEFAIGLCRLDLAALGITPPSVIIGSSVHPFAVLAAKQLAHAYQVPWCFEIRDLWPQSLIDLGIAGPRHPFVWLLKQLERFLLRTTDHVFPVWPGMVSYLKAHAVPANRITVLPHAVNFDQYPTNFIPVPTHTGPLTLCYFGSHRKNNALNPVIQAIATVQATRPGQLRAVFIGEGEDKAALQTYAADQQADIEFRPGVPKRALAEALFPMDGFIISVHASPLYRKYGLSFNKLYDAAAIGRPMILTTDAVQNFVTAAQSGWVVPPQDVPALAQAIEAWMDATPAEREGLGRQAWTYARTHHDVTKLADTLLGVVEPLCKTNKNDRAMSHSNLANNSHDHTRRDGILSDMMTHTLPIRRATIHDATRLADIHKAALPHSFLPQLGPRLLAACYRSWITDPTVIALVATDLGRPMGLLIASLDPQASRMHLMRTNLWPLGLALLRALGTPRRLRGCWESYRAGRGTLPTVPNPPRTELLVLAISPLCQRMGVGHLLLQEFRRTLRTTGYPDHFGVVVGGNLTGAHAFYQRTGGTPASMLHVHRHTTLSTYYVYSPLIP